MATFTPQNKATSVWSAIVKAASGFLLKEDSFYLLLETGDKIIVEPATGANWVPQSKN